MTAGNVKPAKAIGYVRVSTEGQATGGIGLEAQRDRIEAWCKVKRSGVDLAVADRRRIGGVRALTFGISGDAQRRPLLGAVGPPRHLYIAASAMTREFRKSLPEHSIATKNDGDLRYTRSRRLQCFAK